MGVGELGRLGRPRGVTLVIEFHPGNVIPHTLDLPPWQGGIHHGQVGLPTGTGKCSSQVLLLPGGVGDPKNLLTTRVFVMILAPGAGAQPGGKVGYIPIGIPGFESQPSSRPRRATGGGFSDQVLAIHAAHLH